MSNKTGFNTTGFNAGTASLVFVSATAAFTAGVTSDFTGGAYAIKASTDFVNTSETVFESGLKTSLLYADLASESGNYFHPSVDRSGNGTWNVQGTNEFNASVDISGKGDFAISSYFFANTEFRIGEGTWTTSSDLEGTGNRVDFAAVSLISIQTLVNDADPQINGLMTGAWESSNATWIEPTVDRGLGYINHDAYGFLNIDGNWDNTSFLTALFTTGAFVNVNADIDMIANRVINGGDLSWSSEIDLTMTPDSKQVSYADFPITATTEIIATREIHASSANWSHDATTFTGKARMSRVGHWSLVNVATINAITKSQLAGETNFTPTSALEFEQPVIWKRARTNWKATGKVTKIKTLKIKSANADLIAALTNNFVSTRIKSARVFMSGLGSTLYSGGVLRLVDAPVSRQFHIKKRDRSFTVPGTNKKLEVST